MNLETFYKNIDTIYINAIQGNMETVIPSTTIPNVIMDIDNNFNIIDECNTYTYADEDIMVRIPRNDFNFTTFTYGDTTTLYEDLSKRNDEDDLIMNFSVKSLILEEIVQNEISKTKRL